MKVHNILLVFSLFTFVSCSKDNSDESATECKDLEGYEYKTIKIGNQVWMAENLRVTKFRNGDLIPNVTSDGSWENAITPAYCNYDNDIAKGNIYGKIYNWYALMDSRGLAPKGWHIPSKAEYETLINFIGGKDIAGSKLKEIGTEHWNYNVDATNQSGFSALGGGGRWKETTSVRFWWIKEAAIFWTKSEGKEDENDEYGPIYFSLSYDYSGIGFSSWTPETMGYYIRCVKD